MIRLRRAEAGNTVGGMPLIAGEKLIGEGVSLMTAAAKPFAYHNIVLPAIANAIHESFVVRNLRFGIHHLLDPSHCLLEGDAGVLLIPPLRSCLLLAACCAFVAAF